MPSVFGHAVIPLATRLGLGPVRIPRRLLAVGLVACMLPDADVAMRFLDVARDSAWAHRGLTHSVAFALLAGVVAACSARALGARPLTAFTFVLACMLSHPLLDMATDGGPGVMLAWPFSEARLFHPWRPIEVSPIGLGFLSLRGLEVLASELVWIVLPAGAGAALARRRLGAPR